MAIELNREDAEITVCDKDLSGVADGDPDVSYTIRKLTQPIHRKILKQHTSHEFVRGVGRQEKFDAQAITDDLLDYVLVGWSGVLLKGEPAPCTRDWKLNGLDVDRKRALIDKAGMNEIARVPEVRAASFPSATRDV